MYSHLWRMRVVKTIITNGSKMQQKPAKNLTKISENNGAKYNFVCLFKDGHVKKLYGFYCFLRRVHLFVCLSVYGFLYAQFHPIHVGYEIFHIIANPKKFLFAFALLLIGVKPFSAQIQKQTFKIIALLQIILCFVRFTNIK